MLVWTVGGGSNSAVAAWRAGTIAQFAGHAEMTLLIMKRLYQDWCAAGVYDNWKDLGREVAAKKNLHEVGTIK